MGEDRFRLRSGHVGSRTIDAIALRGRSATGFSGLGIRRIDAPPSRPTITADGGAAKQLADQSSQTTP